MIAALYSDGGVISKNPSHIGGTWAYCLVSETGMVLFDQSGVITPADAGMETITNNLTEMLALLRGLEHLGDNFRGTVYSDSQITLGRVSQGWKWTGIPSWMHAMYRKQRARLAHWDEIKFVLLSGHPTAADLERGIGKRGYPVSIHNVACDKACGLAAKEYVAGLQAQAEEVLYAQRF